MRALAKCLAVAPAILLLSQDVNAQEPDTSVLNAAMKKYAGDNSVILNYHQQLVIRYEDGELQASTTITKERLLTGELSPSMDHYDDVLDGYFDEITNLDAVAYIPQKQGGFRQVHKYSIFSGAVGEGLSDSRSLITSFTGLTKGSFIRFTASQDHPDLTAIPIYFPTSNYPVVHADYEVVAPKYVDVHFVEKGLNMSAFKQTREEKNGNYIYHFTADNLPAYHDFDHVPSALYYEPHVITYIAAYRLPGVSKDSVLLSDADHLYKSQYKYVGNINVKQDTMLQRIVRDVTEGDKTQRQKAEHIYQWVQKNVHYIAFESGLGAWIPREADTVCKKMYGDCKDMASLLMQMCRMAGIDAHFTWIGTAERPYTYEETPVPIASNHMICALKLDGEWMFIDGTHFNLPFGGNRDDIQGKEAMIAIDKDHYKIVTIPTMAADKSVTTDSTVLHLAENNYSDLEGTFMQRYTGYPAWNLGYVMDYTAQQKDEKDKVVRSLTMRGNDKYQLSNYDMNISDKGNRDVTISGKFTVSDYVHHIGKDYVVNMNLLRHMENDHIDTTDRQVAWYNRYKGKAREVVVLELPKNFKVTYLPKTKEGKLNDLWSYKIAYKAEGNRVIETKEFTMNTMEVDKRYFTEHNNLIAALDKEYKESVVLTAK